MTTLSLLNFEGVDGATSFIDETTNQVWSPLGTARISNLDKAFGVSCLRLDSVNLSSISTTLVTSLVADFTIEFMYKDDSISNYTENIIKVSTSDGLKWFEINTQGDLLTVDTDVVSNLIYRNVSNWLYDTSTVDLGWNHIAICRKDNLTRIFVNGLCHSATEQLIDDYDIITFGLGTGLNAGGSLNGWIDSVRVIDESIYNTSYIKPQIALELLYVISLFNENDGIIYNVRYDSLDGVSQVNFNGNDLDNSIVFLCDDPSGGGGVVIIPNPVPDSTNIITGNVKKFGLPYSLQLVAVSVELIPEVVGSTTSDVVTGDYSIDVWPWEGDTLVYAAPDYGDEFVPGAFIAAGEILHPTVPNKNVYIAGADGTLGLIEPIWPDSGIIVSGTVTFTAQPLYRPLINGFVKPTVTPI